MNKRDASELVKAYWKSKRYAGCTIVEAIAVRCRDDEEDEFGQIYSFCFPQTPEGRIKALFTVAHYFVQPKIACDFGEEAVATILANGLAEAIMSDMSDEEIRAMPGRILRYKVNDADKN